jgi:2,4-didehydro-3-deoxy-L-rhamnonate hydrolase
MKLLRYGAPGNERPGVLDKAGTIRDLSRIVNDIDVIAIGPERLRHLREIDLQTLPIVVGNPRLGVPIAGVGKIVGIGLNYRDHAEEANLPLPTQPIVFLKAITCLSGPDDDVIMPKGSTKMDWEVELGIVIGTKAQSVDEVDALDCVAGYCVVNDVSERYFQLECGGTWDKGKSFDTFGPVGPWLVTADEVGNVQNLGLWLDVNGVRKQTGSTSKMIFSCAELVSYVSKVMTLMPGDIIATGTPAGVGMGAKPPQYLEAGDVLTLGIEKLGSQTQRVITFPGSYV